MKKIIIVFSGIILLFLLLTVILSNHSDDPDDVRDFRIAYQKDYRIYAVPIPDSIAFAGELVPLPRQDLRERLDRELLITTYQHSQTMVALKRSKRFFETIEPILKKFHIPDDFKYLAVAESNLSNAISPSNAVGVWQFLKATGIKYGLEIHEEVDERYHLEKSTEAACKYLLDSFRMFGSWTSAAASFNRGQQGFSDALNSQEEASFYDLYLNEETSRYVFRILAIKTVFSNPKAYGFYLTDEDYYPTVPVSYLSVDSSVTDWVRFSKQQGITYLTLREHNPWIRKMALNNKNRKTYGIKIPEK